MSDKRYPTRMHEVLGVEPNEEFYINGEFGIFFLTKEGYLTSDNAGRNSNWIVHAINHGITRRPRLTEEQVAQLKALVTLGFKWLCQDSNDYYVVYVNKPVKSEYGWDRGGHYVLLGFGLPADVITDLVSWSDPAPLDIVQTLRDAGVEVDDA